MRVLKEYDEIVTWWGGEDLFIYDIAAEMDRLCGVATAPDTDGDPEKFALNLPTDDDELTSVFDRTVCIRLYGSPDIGFAVSVSGSGFENDAPKTVFKTRAPAEQEARRLFERRKTFEYLRNLFALKAVDDLMRARAIDESNLTEERRPRHRKALAEIERQVKELLESLVGSDKPC